MEVAKGLSNNKQRKRRNDYNNLAGYAFISPWLIGFILFTIIPIGASFILSFTQYDLLSSPKWVGLENYKTMFLHDERYISALKATFSYVFVAVPLRLIFALFIAVLLVRDRKMVSVYRAAFYIPSLIGGSVAVAVMWRQLFGVNGALNSILIELGVIDKGIGWIGNPHTAMWTLILLAAWQFGSPMLIFVAGLKQIPTSYYEAAYIDGANSWQRFTKITMPLLTPIIFFNFIMQTISGFMAFTESYLITQGGPFDRTLFYALYLFEKAFKFYEMGYGCAMAWVLLLIIGVFTALIFKSSNYWVYYESKGEW
ncbi:sugar ABC transporter permease [Caldicoprobacter algeriensis]|uniref:carbohydrate ABC transporter permease n=1 Tax=Caldicoprobacter algeriensis TaxID=699281 RepID=UPI00207A6B5E|nr:sugar ABC transporter permease [Caldicoprobacter algeriensis]MCM8900212.1 sugar ABC transporter permease [Caldicoprobacter algeriensis]